ncbi:MAG: AarF/ABC1/UbiB kinase family protein, partial [Nitrospirae bacterium]|nr:AarF/ABC1/UbiB kinase family protein [Nitrospirota bacterium]
MIPFKQTYRDIQRLRQILNVFLKHGFGHLIERANLQGYIPLGKRLFRFPPREEPPHTTAERFRFALEELGPTFVKFGQILSLRRDIFPEEFILELQKLQDNVPPFSTSGVRASILSELKKTVEELYASFEEAPLAAASIGQVHRAVLRDGSEVVVKVQRPNIEKTIETDLSILTNLAKLIVKYLPESRLYDPVGLVDEFRKVIHRELDFRTEGRNGEKFRNYFKDSKTLFVPKVIWPLSAKRVLTLEYSTGRKVSEVGEDSDFRRRLAKNFNDAYLQQIFEFGFFHADPHPGNIFILSDGRICFHDFGIMGHLDEETMESLANLFLAFLEKDIGGMADCYLNVGIVSGDLDQKGFQRDLKEFIEAYYDLPLREFSFAEVMNSLIDIGRRYRIAVPTDLLLLGKTFMIVESIVRTLDPDFNLIDNIRPYAQVLLRKRVLRPKRLYRDGLKM